MKPQPLTKLAAPVPAARPPSGMPLLDKSARMRERRTRYVLACFGILLGAFALVHVPRYFDLPLETWINSYAGRPIPDRLFYDLDTYFIFSGAIVVALIWSCWFGSADPDMRARLIAGIGAAIAAGAISRFLQHILTTHPRPFYDPALGFHLPSVTNPDPLNTWNSFPSDHAAVFFGLAAVVTLARPKLGYLAFVWLAFVESSRSYVGAHYPSDLIGGAALGIGMVWTAQTDRIVTLGRRIAAWEQSSPALFYMAAFLLSYELAIIFADIRSIVGAMTLIHELRHIVG